MREKERGGERNWGEREVAVREREMREKMRERE